MDTIMQLVEKHNLFLVEDAAQAIDSFYKGKALGSFGHFATFSFHETKNIMSGEGGMLVVNDPQFVARAEIIREKGTNRSAFFRGEVDKYNWVDIGSSFLPSDIIAAVLWAQLEQLDDIQSRRKALWQQYYDALAPIAENVGFELPEIPEGATNNAHMFYLVFKSEADRDRAIAQLKEQKIQSVFHYISLHNSPYFKEKYTGDPLPNSDRFTAGLLRLPFFYELPAHCAQGVAEALTSLAQ